MFETALETSAADTGEHPSHRQAQPRHAARPWTTGVLGAKRLTIGQILDHVSRLTSPLNAEAAHSQRREVVEATVSVTAKRQLLNCANTLRQTLAQLGHLAQGRAREQGLDCTEAQSIQALHDELMSVQHRLLGEWQLAAERFARRTKLLPSQCAFDLLAETSAPHPLRQGADDGGLTACKMHDQALRAIEARQRGMIEVRRGELSLVGLARITVQEFRYIEALLMHLARQAVLDLGRPSKPCSHED